MRIIVIRDRKLMCGIGALVHLGLLFFIIYTEYIIFFLCGSHFVEDLILIILFAYRRAKYSIKSLLTFKFAENKGNILEALFSLL